MHAPPPDILLDLAELDKLTNVILTRYGFDFSNYAKSSFKRRIMLVLRKNGLQTVDQLVQKIVHNESFFAQFLEDVTVNTTELFRDPPFWQFLRDSVLPRLAERESFNVWHCACSSGEEVVSLGILLQEAGILNRAKVFASDINKQVLKRAAQAKFPVRHLDLYAANYQAVGLQNAITEYMQVQDDHLVFRPELVQNVQFKDHDLAVDPFFYRFDLILCRNVMIYFDQELQNRVFQLLNQSLFIHGYLALGTKESMIWNRQQEKYITVSESEKVFQKIQA